MLQLCVGVGVWERVLAHDNSLPPASLPPPPPPPPSLPPSLPSCVCACVCGRVWMCSRATTSIFHPLPSPQQPPTHPPPPVLVLHTVSLFHAPPLPLSTELVCGNTRSVSAINHTHIHTHTSSEAEWTSSLEAPFRSRKPESPGYSIHWGRGCMPIVTADSLCLSLCLSVRPSVRLVSLAGDIPNSPQITYHAQLDLVPTHHNSLHLNQA